MPAYNFQKQFVRPILDGSKRSTIRPGRKHGNPEPGKPIQLYNGMRTRSCLKIKEVICSRIRPIIIDTSHGGGIRVILDGIEIPGAEKEALAKADGFKDIEAFAEFFRGIYEMPANLWLIEW